MCVFWSYRSLLAQDEKMSSWTKFQCKWTAMGAWLLPASWYGTHPDHFLLFDIFFCFLFRHLFLENDLISQWGEIISRLGNFFENSLQIEAFSKLLILYHEFKLVPIFRFHIICETELKFRMVKIIFTNFPQFFTVFPTKSTSSHNNDANNTKIYFRETFAFFFKKTSANFYVSSVQN